VAAVFVRTNFEQTWSTHRKRRGSLPFVLEFVYLRASEGGEFWNKREYREWSEKEWLQRLRTLCRKGNTPASRRELIWCNRGAPTRPAKGD